jgi:GntR family transcriptional repressor for pyruvate dehydrogenase complex
MSNSSDGFSFTPVKTTRLYEVVVQQIETMIDKGEFQPGDQLPSERELADRLGVSRAVLTQAFRVLESNGLIEVRAGSGRYIRQGMTLENDTGVVYSLERAAIKDLLEVREVLECRIAELACERANDKDLHEIEATINRFGDYETDINFHLAIAQAMHNIVFVNMLRSNMSLLYKTREHTLMKDRKKEEIVGEHRGIFQAIAERNKSDAVKKVMEHIHGIQLRLSS